MRPAIVPQRVEYALEGLRYAADHGRYEAELALKSVTNPDVIGHYQRLVSDLSNDVKIYDYLLKQLRRYAELRIK